MAKYETQLGVCRNPDAQRRYINLHSGAWKSSHRLEEFEHGENPSRKYPKPNFKHTRAALILGEIAPEQRGLYEQFGQSAEMRKRRLRTQ